MARSTPPQINRPATKRAMDGLLLFGGAIVLLFALVGLVSAGTFVGDKLSSKKSTPVKSAKVAGTPVALQDIARAQAQATAIVKSAQAAGKTIIKTATHKANKQSRTILSDAQKRAQAIAPPSSSQTSTTPGYQGGTTGGTTGGTSGTGTTGQTPGLSRFPKSWQLIAYSVSFGSGPGTAGGVSLINRGNQAFSGVVTVQYLGRRGVIGSATAPFSGIPPGRYVVPLNGPPLPVGATYRILVSNIH